MTTADQIQPGDFAAVVMHGPAGLAVRIGEWANGNGFGNYEHALIAIGGGQIVQAMPDGATCIRRGVELGDLWSTGIINPTSAQRLAIVAAARSYVGVGYSSLDYLALAAHRLHLPTPVLRHFIASTHHMICSQLVDQCYFDAGVHLFDDGRWPGYVTPADLAGLILSGGQTRGRYWQYRRPQL